MAQVIQMPTVRVEQKVIDELEVLLKQARSGQIVGLAYVASRPGDAHAINLVGDYAAAPQTAFLPVCRVMMEVGIAAGAAKR